MSATVFVCVLNAVFWKVAVYFVDPFSSQVAGTAISEAVFTVSVCLWLLLLEQMRVAVTWLLSADQAYVGSPQAWPVAGTAWASRLSSAWHTEQ